ncbi:MAG: signal peptidase I [Desulfobacteraceae bacterium]|nr:signal peptidase I [Desulfobacteraceae bacterium]MBC2757813.1 signal peptidase I [Desulfobacteraceae bacterium]
MPFNGTADFKKDASVFMATEISGLCEEILNQGVELRIKVTGRSMRPVINTDDVVTVKKVPVEKIRIGDLLLIKNYSGSLILHRLIKKECYVGHTVYRTKGDSLLIPDVGVTADRIMGKVYKIEKLNKSRSNFFMINLESVSGQIFHSAMILLQLIMVFRLRFRALRKQFAR